MSEAQFSGAPPRTFRLLGRHGAQSPVAVGAAGVRTALDLTTDAHSIAATLPAREGDVLVVCADRYLATACMLAAWSRGRAIVLPPNAQPGSVREVADAEATAVVLHDSDLPGGVDVRRIVTQQERATREYEAPTPIPAERRVATVWTSGSSGAPRLCTKTAAQLFGEAETLASLFGEQAGAVRLSTVPAFHLYGLLFGVLEPLVSGGVFVRETPFFAPAVAATLVRTSATVLVSVPAHLRALEVLTRESVGRRVPRVCSSGASLSRATAASLASSLGWSVTEIFGSTETGGIGYRETVDSPYIPFPGVTVTTSRDGGTDGDGDTGGGERLVLRSPFTSEGASVAVVTDDLVRIERDGRFFTLGRIGGVVKVAGKRVSLAEVEARLREVPGVEDVAVLAREAGGARATRLAAIVAGRGLSAAALRATLQMHFDPVVVPRPIVLVHALPRDATGKLKREDLLAMLGDGAPHPQPHPGADLSLREREGGAFDVHIPIDARAFAGHFPLHPVLPGVVQLETLVLGAVRRRWPELRHPRRIVRLKFRKPVLPGDDLIVRVERVEHRVTFTVERDGAPCASGSLYYEAPPSDGPPGEVGGP